MNPVSDTAAGPSGRTHRRILILVVLCSLAFLTYLDRICIMRVQGDLGRDLHFEQLTAADEQALRDRGLDHDEAARTKLGQDRATRRMGWVFSAFVAGYVLFEIPGGWLGDLFGARVVIVRIVLCWSLFTAMTGGVKWIAGWFVARPEVALLLGILVAVRFLFGIGEAGAYPNIARALGRWFPVRERATAQSFVWFSSRLGGAAAPAIIGGLMALTGGWQRAFLGLGIVGIVWAVFFRWWFRDRPEDDPAANDAERAWIRGVQPAPGSIYDDDHRPRLQWTSLLAPNLLALDLASFCVSFSFYFYITFLPRYLKEEFHIDYADSQWLTGLPLLLGGIACLLGGGLSDRILRRTGSKRWCRRLPPLLGWGAAGVCALVVSQLHSATAVIVLICVAFACQDLGVPSMWSVPADVGGRYAGTVGGCMNAAGAIGGMLSPLVAAWVSINFGWGATFLVFGVVYLVGALAWLRIDAGAPLIVEAGPIAEPR